MIIVVEIASRAGTRACKEYDAPSYNAAIEAVKRELRAYPTLRVTDIWIKDDRAVNLSKREGLLLWHHRVLRIVVVSETIRGLPVQDNGLITFGRIGIQTGRA